MSLYTEELTHRLMEALEGHGYSPDQVRKLAQCGDHDDLKLVLDGKAKIVPFVQEPEKTTFDRNRLQVGQ